jgi:hypothetical protein
MCRPTLLARSRGENRALMLLNLQPPGILLLYPFRYGDPLTGKWVRARYVAEPHEIALR